MQSGSRIPRLDVEVGCGIGQVHNGVEIDVFGDEVTQAGDLGGGVLPLPRRDQAQVARRHEDRLGARNPPQHRDAESVESAHDLGTMTRRGDPVEDHTGDRDIRIKRRQTCHHCGVGEGRMSGVDDHDHRGLGRGGDLGAGPASGPELAVEEAHHSLDDRNVRRIGGDEAMGQQRGHELVTTHDGVQVAARTTTGHRVVTGIDVIRPDLERRHRPAGGTQGCHETCRDGRLTASRRRGGDEDSWNAHHHSIPA